MIVSLGIIIIFPQSSPPTIFLYPWAVNYKASGGLMLFNLVEMLVFVAILLVGYIYVWKRGGLEWG
jgi:NADH-quinone oxidoreductase subunit A